MYRFPRAKAKKIPQCGVSLVVMNTHAQMYTRVHDLSVDKSHQLVCEIVSHSNSGWLQTTPTPCFCGEGGGGKITSYCLPSLWSRSVGRRLRSGRPHRDRLVFIACRLVTITAPRCRSTSMSSRHRRHSRTQIFFFFFVIMGCQ